MWRRFLCAVLLRALLSSAHTFCGSITSDATWGLSSGGAPGDLHILNCTTFVRAGATLTIEPGTTIYVRTNQGDGSAHVRTPSLVIEQGAKIIAAGTKDKPITFTSILEVHDPRALPQRGLWGGLLVLGRSIISRSGGVGRMVGMGMQSAAYTSELELPYGGTDAEDDSGVLRYVRVWYGGETETGGGAPISDHSHALLA